VRPLRLCRFQNYEMSAGADGTQSGRHIPNVGIPFRTISIPVAWEELGGTIIPTTFRRSTGGAMEKRDPAGVDCLLRRNGQ
jgi:hypothetical protein